VAYQDFDQVELKAIFFEKCIRRRLAQVDEQHLGGARAIVQLGDTGVLRLDDAPPAKDRIAPRRPSSTSPADD
jgi:hypothetical protein